MKSEGCPKTKAWRDKKYLEYVRQQPCVVCGHTENIHAHHIRLASNSGTGMRPGDLWALSLCHLHHLEYHQLGKETFYERHGIDIYRELFTITKAWIEGGGNE